MESPLNTSSKLSTVNNDNPLTTTSQPNLRSPITISFLPLHLLTLVLNFDSKLSADNNDNSITTIPTRKLPSFIIISFASSLQPILTITLLTTVLVIEEPTILYHSSTLCSELSLLSFRRRHQRAVIDRCELKGSFEVAKGEGLSIFGGAQQPKPGYWYPNSA